METNPYPNYDFYLWRGEDKDLFFTFSYQLEDGTTAPIELDGCSFLMTLGLKDPKKDIDLLSSKNGRMILGNIQDFGFVPQNIGATVLYAKFPHGATKRLPDGEAYYDLIKIRSDGKRELMLAGTVTIYGGVSYD